MFPMSAGALALLVLLGGARAEVLDAAEDAAPGLRLTRLSGRLEVEPGPPALSALRSGSTVRVRSGFAVFDSDYHATVRAGEGDAFLFQSFTPEGSRSGTLRVSAVGREPRALEVSVGAQKLRLRKGGAVSVTAVWAGEMIVRSEGAGAELAAGSLGKDGSILLAGRALAPGETLTVTVPERLGFEQEPADPGRLSVSAADGRAFSVQSYGAAPAALAAREAEARRILSGWPVISLRTAEAMLEKYGPPDLAIGERLSWYDHAPWKVTTVHRDPHGHVDVLEQTIAYAVPRGKVRDLASLDLALTPSRDGRALSAVSEAEETNILALNLADEVARGVRSPEAARVFYLRTVLQWNAGKSSPYMKELFK